jgi:putative zinc finger/helix-turn-helix YgiT family protein
MNCYNCGRAELRAEVGAHEYKSAGLPYSVVLLGVSVQRCPACGEEVVTIPNPVGLHRLLALSIAELERPLLPQEVRFLRKFLDKSAVDMGALMGVDAKTLSRWENGRQKMGKVAERLLRLLVHQLVAPEVTNFAQDLFPRLAEDGPALSVGFTTSNAGWQQAA